jgi:hypothetical protein
MLDFGGGGVVGRKRTRPSPLRGLCVLMPRLTWAAVSACLSRPDTPRRGLPAAAAPAVRLPPDRTDPVLVLFSFKGGRRRDYCGQKCAKQKCLDYDRDGEGGVGLASMSSTDGSDPMGGCGGFGALTDVFGMCRQCPPSAGGGATGKQSPPLQLCKDEIPPGAGQPAIGCRAGGAAQRQGGC